MHINIPVSFDMHGGEGMGQLEIGDGVDVGEGREWRRERYVVGSREDEDAGDGGVSAG